MNFDNFHEVDHQFLFVCLFEVFSCSPGWPLVPDSFPPKCWGYKYVSPSRWSFSLAKSTCYTAKVKATCRGLHVLVMVWSALRCSGESLRFMATWNESLLFQMFSLAVCVHACMQVPVASRRGVRSGSGVGTCELPNIGAGNWTLVFYESNKCS